jgi:hypothetical protein
MKKKTVSTKGVAATESSVATFASSLLGNAANAYVCNLNELKHWQAVAVSPSSSDSQSLLHFGSRKRLLQRFRNVMRIFFFGR